MIEIGIVDYGAGNIASVRKSLEYAGASTSLLSTPEQILSASKILLPGVGAAGLAIKNLHDCNLVDPLNEAVLKRSVPIMGICVGMQLMAEDLYEFGHHKGLGWVSGKVVPLRSLGVISHPVPQIGWNDIVFKDNLMSLDKQFGRHKSFYFAHSFALDTPQEDIVNSTVEYEKTLTSGIIRDNIVAFQFHPEKSQVSGDILMQWFLHWNP